MKKVTVSLATAFVIHVSALAQAPAGAVEQAPFPPDAEVLKDDALKQKLAGKAFKITLANGDWWRLDYRDNGYVHLNTRRSTDMGKWKVEGEKVCSDWSRSSSGCTEYRAKGNSLLTTWRGQIVELVPD